MRWKIIRFSVTGEIQIKTGDQMIPSARDDVGESGLSCPAGGHVGCSSHPSEQSDTA